MRRRKKSSGCVDQGSEPPGNPSQVAGNLRGPQNTASFEEVASELYGATEGKGQLWANAAQLGRDLDPGNPLYKSADVAAESQFTKTQVLDRSPLADAAPAAKPVPAEPVDEPSWISIWINRLSQ